MTRSELRWGERDKNMAALSKPWFWFLLLLKKREREQEKTNMQILQQNRFEEALVDSVIYVTINTYFFSEINITTIATTT